MDYTAILKRAFLITKKHRALWLFGMLLALFSGGGNTGSRYNFGGNSGSSSPAELPFGGNNPFGGIDPGVIFTVVIALFCVIFILVLVGLVVVPVARTALIGMVNEVESGETVTISTGWRIGWSREAWKVFLVSFLIGLPIFIVILFLVGVTIAPFLLGFMDESLMPVGIGLGILMLLFFILVMIFIGLVVRPIMELSWRYAALQYTGARESIRRAFYRIRTDFKRVAISALVMFGVNIGLGVVLFFVMIVVLIVGALLGAIPAVAGYLLTQEFAVALLAGIPFFLLVVIPLGIFAGGLQETYHSTAWTLIFNELEAPKDVDTADSVLPDVSEDDLPATPEDSETPDENPEDQPPENLTL